MFVEFVFHVLSIGFLVVCLVRLDCSIGSLDGTGISPVNIVHLNTGTRQKT